MGSLVKFWKSLISSNNSIVKAQKAKVESEIHNYTDKIINILKNKINISNINEKIFAYKFIADFYYHKYEVSNKYQKINIIELIKKYYKESYFLGQEKLNPNDYIYLIIIINYSLFFCQVYNSNKSFQILKKGFNEAIKYINENNINLDKDCLFLLEKI